MPRRLPAARISLALWAGLLAIGAQTPAPAPVASATVKPTFEEWAQIILEGKTCGFGSTITTPVDTPAGKGFRTELQEEFVVKRMGVSLKLNEVSHITERADGAVLSFDQVQSGMGSDIELHGTRDGDDLVVTSRGQTQRYHIPALAALGPEAIRRQSNAIPLKAGTPFSLNTFTTDYPQAVAVEKGQVVGQEDHVVKGVTRKLWKITSELSIMPGIGSVAWVDDSDNDVEMDITIPGIGNLQQIVCDRAECMKQPEGAEVFAGTLIAPQRAITDLSRQVVADYRVTSDTKQKLDLWNHGEQRVLKSEPGAAEIEITVPVWLPEDATYTLPHPDTPELHAYLQPSAYLESGSPEIQELAKKAVDGETNPVRAAMAIERFVDNYITKKDLNIGFASAEETAKSREGDCTEHAVLCAALGRAVGLPTRCVLGLGYIPPGESIPTISSSTDMKTGLFGFHMWAEACVGPDRWMAMDAALGGFDVGHVAIMKSALADIDPMVDLNMPVLTLMENLHITVLKTATRDQLAPAVPASAPVSAPVPPAPVSPTPAPPASQPSKID